MAKHFVYTNNKQNRTIFEKVVPNYMSIDMVDKLVLEKTGSDPRLNSAIITREIHMVSDDFKIPQKRKKRR